jgi:hypothetical protein
MTTRLRGAIHGLKVQSMSAPSIVLQQCARAGRPRLPANKRARRILVMIEMLFGKVLDHHFILFFAVVKVLSMIVIIFVGIPLVVAILFRLLIPVFIVDMPCHHRESNLFV